MQLLTNENKLLLCLNSPSLFLKPRYIDINIYLMFVQLYSVIEWYIGKSYYCTYLCTVLVVHTYFNKRIRFFVDIKVSKVSRFVQLRPLLSNS